MNKKDRIKPYIIQAMVQRLSEQEALKMLSDRGFDISARLLYRLKKEIKESRFDRLHLIAREGLVDTHLEILDCLSQIQAEIWAQYHKCKDPFKKVLIMEKLAEILTYVSAYTDASQYIYEKSIRKKKKIESSETISST